MNTEQILQEIETLPYNRRIQHIIDVGRRSLTDPSLQHVLRDMEQGEFYERTLCLHACLGNRNSIYAVGALNDSSAIIRQQAVKIVPLICDQTQVRQALSSISSDIYVAFLKRVYKVGGFQQAIDNFIQTLAHDHDYRLPIVLPFWLICNYRAISSTCYRTITDTTVEANSQITAPVGDQSHARAERASQRTGYTVYQPVECNDTNPG